MTDARDLSSAKSGTIHTYSDPPIAEVICECYFETPFAWQDEPVKQQFRDLLGREDFPIIRDKHASPPPSQLQAGVISTLTPLIARKTQFVSADEKTFFQVSGNLLAVNRLRPYQSWEYFLPIVHRGVDAYRSLTGSTQIMIPGLRYINQIEIPGGPGVRLELEDYFEFYPYVGKRLPQTHGDFIIGIKISFEEGFDALALELSCNATNLERQAFVMVLDLYYRAINRRQPSLTVETVFDWLDIAHRHIQDTFEGCLTERARALFTKGIH